MFSVSSKEAAICNCQKGSFFIQRLNKHALYAKLYIALYKGKKMKKIAIILGLMFFSTNSAFGQPKKLQTKEKPKDWTTVIDIFHIKNPQMPKIQFETGVLGYYTERTRWTFARVEPFIKVHWAILDKYLQLYTIFSFDSSWVNYELSHWQNDNFDVSAHAKLSASGNPALGGGIKLFLVGWRMLNLYGYVQVQTATLSDAKLESADITINGITMDIMDQVRDHVDISYKMRRMDTGAIFTYQPWTWFTASAAVGYFWFNATVKIAIDQQMSNAVAALTKMDARNIIPKDLTIDEGSAFGLLGFKFRIYKRFNLYLEGAILPTKHPIYYGSASFIIEGDK